MLPAPLSVKLITSRLSGAVVTARPFTGGLEPLKTSSMLPDFRGKGCLKEVGSFGRGLAIMESPTEEPFLEEDCRIDCCENGAVKAGPGHADWTCECDFGTVNPNLPGV